MNPREMPPTLSEREPPRPRLVLAGLLFTLLALGLLWPLSAQVSRRLYDPNTFTGGFLAQGDVQLNSWILAWDAHAIGTGNVRGLFDANIFYPEPNALAYSEHMLGVLPVFAPL